jgi:hypothetical protein
MSATKAKKFAAALDNCPLGEPGWRQFESVCIDVLTWLFVPPLRAPHIQSRTINGTERRDAVFPNRNLNATANWGYLHHKLEAELILFEFKNYDFSAVGATEVTQTNGYMRSSMGKLGILCCATVPEISAFRKRNTIFSENGRIILFLTKQHLKEMLFIKERGEDPSDLILDLVEEFKLQHE